MPILDLLTRVRTAMGISYTLSLLNDYIDLGERDKFRVTHSTFFLLYGVLPGTLQNFLFSHYVWTNGVGRSPIGVHTHLDPKALA